VRKTRGGYACRIVQSAAPFLFVGAATLTGVACSAIFSLDCFETECGGAPSASSASSAGGSGGANSKGASSAASQGGASGSGGSNVDASDGDSASPCWPISPDPCASVNAGGCFCGNSTIDGFAGTGAADCVYYCYDNNGTIPVGRRYTTSYIACAAGCKVATTKNPDHCDGNTSPTFANCTQIP
jgi:hypothetical protein